MERTRCAESGASDAVALLYFIQLSFFFFFKDCRVCVCLLGGSKGSPERWSLGVIVALYFSAASLSCLLLFFVLLSPLRALLAPLGAPFIGSRAAGFACSNLWRMYRCGRIVYTISPLLLSSTRLSPCTPPSAVRIRAARPIDTSSFQPPEVCELPLP